jgi:hypothetical protein
MPLGFYPKHAANTATCFGEEEEVEGRLISVPIVTGLFTLFAAATDASLYMRTGD